MTRHRLVMEANVLRIERDAAMDRIAELERAAETSRAEHAAAFGLATARIRELEGEREALIALLCGSQFESKCERLMWGTEHVPGEGCSDYPPCPEHLRLSFVASVRIEKATKRAPGAVGK